MKYLRKRALAGEILAGAWLNLASSLTAEIAAQAGFDWVLIDQEHGAGSDDTLLHQLQVLEAGPSVPIVRIAWNESWRFKRALDFGAGGIMIPYVNTADEARQAVSSMRYPPLGVRGAARFQRASGFGRDFETYFSEANENLLTIVQIETAAAVDQVEEIAAVEGVDVLFVGPLDLSVSMGIRQQLDHPDFRAAIARVVNAARNAGKAVGTLIPTSDKLPATIEDGYTFIAVGSDGGLVASGMQEIAGAFTPYRESPAEQQ
jgi:4-hydroxy-2-oxoheptanedioate aldolase